MDPAPDPSLGRPSLRLVDRICLAVAAFFASGIPTKWLIVLSVAPSVQSGHS